MVNGRGSQPKAAALPRANTAFGRPCRHDRRLAWSLWDESATPEITVSKAPVHTPNVICQAIRDRLLLAFDYGGHHRVVAAYCHGTNRRGVEALRAVQLRGSSSSGGFGFGKLWTVADMRNARTIDETFVADDPDYNPDDSAMRWIHCRI
jgi:hypothetical protein